MHSLLVRQIKKFCRDSVITDQAGFIAAIDSAYSSFENDRSLIEHSLETMSRELGERNRQLAEQLAAKQSVLDKLTQTNNELLELNYKLETAQNQLLQAEKMASIGQLAAGVAHEINNPIGFVHSNFGTLERYLQVIFKLLDTYHEHEKSLSAVMCEQLVALRKELEYDYIAVDVFSLMSESKDGLTRVKKIVQDLKDFSHADTQQNWQWANLHHGIDSTLNIVNNEVKYKADVVREYGEIPEIECLPSQINQVVMNMVVNAAHAMGPTRGKITIRTGVDGDNVWISISDTGSGISKANQTRIFDAFFTTKPVGSGTGLGLSLSYSIVKRHHGRIELDSEIGVGSTFKIILPVRQLDRLP